MDETLVHIKYLNKLLYNTSRTKIAAYSPTLFQNWNQIRAHITNIAKTHYRYTISLPNNIYLHTFDCVRDSIKHFSSVIQTKYDSLSRAYSDKQIKKFVQQRCDDYYDNQKHMIDSLLERSKRTIVIDRVL